MVTVPGPPLPAPALSCSADGAPPGARHSSAATGVVEQPRVAEAPPKLGPAAAPDAPPHHALGRHPLSRSSRSPWRSQRTAADDSWEGHDAVSRARRPRRGGSSSSGPRCRASSWSWVLLRLVEATSISRHHRHVRCTGGGWPRSSSTIATETIALIRKMAGANRLWGAERVRGELLKLGVRKRTVQEYMRGARPRRPSSPR